MRSLESLPLDRARVKREQLERDLRKCPDFQLYLITEAPDDRARIEHLLMEDPSFKLWSLLTNAIALAAPGTVLAGTSPVRSERRSPRSA
jgi:hypothetical protein